jgi:hypothetical protein
VVILMVLNIRWSKLLYFNILNIFPFIEIDGNQNIKVLKEYVILSSLVHFIELRPTAKLVWVGFNIVDGMHVLV